MRWRAALAVVMFSTATLSPVAHAEAPRAEHRTVSRVEMTKPEHPDLVLLRRQMRLHPELPPITFWYQVAWCETHREWDRGKDWGPNARSWVSGGLGLAHSTFRGYGGRQFANKAANASKWAQIIVANRVAFLGYQTKNVYMTFEDRANDRPFYRPPAGFGRLAGKVRGQGWGGKCREAWFRRHGQPKIALATVKARAIQEMLKETQP